MLHLKATDCQTKMKDPIMSPQETYLAVYQTQFKYETSNFKVRIEKYIQRKQ